MGRSFSILTPLVAVAVFFSALVVPCAAQPGIFTRPGEVNPNSFPTITYSADGGTAAVVYTPGDGRECTVAVFDAKSRALKKTVVIEATQVSAVALSPHGEQIAAASNSGVKIVNLQGELGSTRRVGNGGLATVALAYAPNARYVAASTSDNRVTIYGANTGRLVSTFVNTRPVRALTFTKDSMTLLAGGDDGNIRLYEVEGGRTLRVLAGHSGPVRVIVASPVDRTFVSAGANREMIAWHEWRRSPVQYLTGLRGDAQALAYSPDGRYLLSGDSTNRIVLWYAPLGTQTAMFEGDDAAVASLRFSDDGRKFVSSHADASQTTWDLLTRRPLQSGRFGL